MILLKVEGSKEYVNAKHPILEVGKQVPCAREEASERS